MGGCLLALRLRQAPNGSRKGAKKKKRREGVAFSALLPAAPGSFQAQRMNTRLRRHNPLRLSFFSRLCVNNPAIRLRQAQPERVMCGNA